MKIPVIFVNQTCGEVRSEQLQALIDANEIVLFNRSEDEWIMVGVDPTRGMGGSRYRGPERRGNVLSNS